MQVILPGFFRLEDEVLGELVEVFEGQPALAVFGGLLPRPRRHAHLELFLSGRATKARVGKCL